MCVLPTLRKSITIYILNKYMYINNRRYIVYIILCLYYIVVRSDFSFEAYDHIWYLPIKIPVYIETKQLYHPLLDG